jgi:hypothetical protein
MSSSEPISKSRGLLYLINLFFGGIFLGVALMMASMHFYTGWPDTVLPIAGGALIAIGYFRQSPDLDRPVRNLVRVYALGALAIVIAQLAGRGLAALAAGGIYGSDKFNGQYVNIKTICSLA